MKDFAELVARATAEADGHGGHGPYPYQQRLADDGLPQVLDVPTGAGKTLAATLPWLFRRRFHPDAAVREATPRRLVLVLPQRALVEQTHGAVEGWLQRLGLLANEDDREGVGLHLLLGGASSDDKLWRLYPEQDAVLVGTQDMVLSRLLMRGYGEPRSVWPMSFGLLHAGSHFVFDEVQLMGPGLPTSLQLEGLRMKLGTAIASSSTWMSATVDPELFGTVDAPELSAPVTISDADRASRLGRRLDATRTVGELELGEPPVGRYAAALARTVLDSHRPGTRTIVVLNTVRAAREVYDKIKAAAPRTVLLHSRYRPDDRRAQLERAVDDAALQGPGLIVVTTQVLEAGVDVTSDTLITELAPWSSIVQRAGRCNRDGEARDARLLWVRPPGSGPKAGWPYEWSDLEASAAALRNLEGVAVTSGDLRREVTQTRPVYSVLRRRDLLQLFDTSPDLFGADVDVSRWIRDVDERTVNLAWRPADQLPPSVAGDAIEPLRRDELCPAPVDEVADFLRERKPRAWIERPQDGWVPATASDIRPGTSVLLDVTAGGYDEARGWSPALTHPVTPVPEPSDREQSQDSDRMADDLPSLARTPILLAQHLEDVRDEVAGVVAALPATHALTTDQVDAAVAAGYLHDVGKAHAIFRESVRMMFQAEGLTDDGGPWAKSPGRGRFRHRVPGFRHELVSALLAADPATGLLDDVVERDLAAYLVGAHHGKVRLTVRGDDAESKGSEGHLTVLGVRKGDRVEVTLPDGRQVSAELDPAMALLGDTAAGPSWTARACALRDRDDLGPFRLAFLEALVRVADWRVSADYDKRVNELQVTA